MVGSRLRVQYAVPPQQLLIRNHTLPGNPDENVEVIGQNGVGEDLNPAEIRNFPDHPTKRFLAAFIEKKFAVNGPRHAMVTGLIPARVDLDPVPAHNGKLKVPRRASELAEYPIHGQTACPRLAAKRASGRSPVLLGLRE